MSTYLAYTSPARGHLYPLVPTLEELRRRGHEVRLRTLASEVDLMRDLGIDAQPIDPEIERLEHDDWKAKTPGGANKRVMLKFAQRAEYEIPDLQRAISDLDPDVLMIDISTLGAATLAESGGRPWAQWTPYFTPLPSRDAPPFGLGLRPRSDLIGRLRDRIVEALVLGPPERAGARTANELRGRFGLPQFKRGTDLWDAAPISLYFTAEPFEYPRSDWPESFRLVGPGTWEPPSEPPGWLEPTDRPLVLVTCSTEFQDDGKLVEATLEALAGEDVQVVATTAAVDPARFRPPGNARVERFVPHGPLLRHAACVVCHGGMGITQKALAAGVPVCVVPFGRDQLEVAGHVVVADAGTRLSAVRLRPSRLRGAIRQAMSKRAGAKRVAEGFARAGGAPAAADALEALQ